MPHPLADRVDQIVCKSGFADNTESEARRAKQREYERRWAAANREKLRAAAARYRRQHPDRRNKAKAAWNAKNRDKVNAHNRSAEAEPRQGARREASMPLSLPGAGART